MPPSSNCSRDKPPARLAGLTDVMLWRDFLAPVSCCSVAVPLVERSSLGDHFERGADAPETQRFADHGTVIEGQAFVRSTCDEHDRDPAKLCPDLSHCHQAIPLDQMDVRGDHRRALQKGSINGFLFGPRKFERCGAGFLQSFLNQHGNQWFVLDDKHMTHMDTGLAVERASA